VHFIFVCELPTAASARVRSQSACAATTDGKILQFRHKDALIGGATFGHSRLATGSQRGTGIPGC